jgi:4-hydroxy-tetrahydrodipicolinate synthase
MIKGIIPALITPFDNKGEVNYSMLDELLEFLIERGIHGVFVSGTNGEGPLLSKEERVNLFRAVVGIVNKRIPVIAQIGEITTSDTIYLGKEAIDSGVDAVSIVSPYYYKLSDEALKSHFIRVANALAPIPVYLYNLPDNTGNRIKPEVAKDIMERSNNVRGIKESSKDFQILEDFITVLPSNAAILVGTDSFILPALILGVKGAISALTNSLPELSVGIYNDFLAGKWEEAKSKQLLLHKVRTIVTKQMPLISALKTLLRYRGIEVGNPRPPLEAVSLDQEAILREIIEEVETFYPNIVRGNR